MLGPCPGLLPAPTVCVRCPRSLLVPRALAMRLLGGFAGGFGLEGRGASAFPQVGDVCSEPRPQKTAQKPRLMSKSGPIFCKTVQKSWGAGIGYRAVAVEADFRAPVCAMEGCTLPGSPSLCFCSVKRSCLIMWSWRASRGPANAPGAPSLIRPPRTPKAGVKQDCDRLAEWGRLALEDRGGPAAALLRYRSVLVANPT